MTCNMSLAPKRCFWFSSYEEEDDEFFKKYFPWLCTVMEEPHNSERAFRHKDRSVVRFGWLADAVPIVPFSQKGRNGRLSNKETARSVQFAPIPLCREKTVAWAKTGSVRTKLHEIEVAWSQTAETITQRFSSFVFEKMLVNARQAWEHKGELLWGGMAGSVARNGIKAIGLHFLFAASAATLPAVLLTGMTAGAVAGGVSRLVKTAIANRKSVDKKSYKEGLLSSVAFGALGGGLGAYLFDYLGVSHCIRDLFGVREAHAAEISGSTMSSYQFLHNGRISNTILHPEPQVVTNTSVQNVVTVISSSPLPRDLRALLPSQQFEAMSDIIYRLPIKSKDRLLKIALVLTKQDDLVVRGRQLAHFCKEMSYELARKGNADLADALEVAGLKAAKKAGVLNTLTVAQLCVDHAWNLKQHGDYATAFANARQAIESLSGAHGSESVKRKVMKTAKELIRQCVRQEPGLKNTLAVDATQNALGGTAREVATSASGSLLPEELHNVLPKGQLSTITAALHDLPARAQSKLLKMASSVAQTGNFFDHDRRLVEFCQQGAGLLAGAKKAEAADALTLAGLKAARESNLVNTLAVSEMCNDHAAQLLKEGKIETAFNNARQAMRSAIYDPKANWSMMKNIGKKSWKVINACIARQPGLKAQLG